MAGVTSLDVLFRNAVMTRWDNPPDYECRIFTCDDLPAVLEVAWNNLPLTKVAAFYESDDCPYSSSTFTYNTGSARTQATGSHRFGRPQVIWSMMVGRTEAAVLDEKLNIKKPTTSSKKTEKPTASGKKNEKPTSSSKQTPKPTTVNSKTKAPTTSNTATEKPATLGKKKTTSKGKCPTNKKKQESTFNEEKTDSSYTVAQWRRFGSRVVFQLVGSYPLTAFSGGAQSCVDGGNWQRSVF